MAVKFFSCICAVASGLPMGPEGPMIHLGGLVGGGLGQMELNTPYFLRFRNPKDRRNFISAGIGAGVSSVFGAPVGGLLFAMQDLDVSLLRDIRLSSQIFFCTIVATFTTGLFDSVFKNQFNHEGHFGLFKAKRYILFLIDHEVLSFYVFIPAVILGILGGILGRIFTFMNLKIHKFRRYLLGKMRSRRVKNISRVLEVSSLVVIVGTVSVFLPFPFSCSKYECSSEGPGFKERTVNNYACEKGMTLMVNGTKYALNGSFNQVATLLYARGEKAIRHIFSRDTHREFTYGPLLTVLVVYFILACWAAGTAVSSGLVIPMLFIGGTYGRIVGKTMVDIFGVHAEGQWAWVDPGAFALIGAASFIGGLPGLTMSLAAIMIEITNDTRCLLPVVVAIIVSKYVGDLLLHPLFKPYQAKDVISAPAKEKENDIKDSANTDGCEGKDGSKRLSGNSQKIGSSTFRCIDPIKLRFLRKHRWAEIKEKENMYKEQWVVVQHIDANSCEVKGTDVSRNMIIRFLHELTELVVFKTYTLTEPGMKKQMRMNATDAIISDVEKNHKCVIQKGIFPEQTEKKTEAPTFVADGGSAAGTSATSTMNLPYHSMSFVNDNEVKLDSGQRITIVVGDLTRQTVDVIVNTTNEKVDLNANSCGRALLKVAGLELMKECQKIGSLQPGNIASTGPAKLKCKRVYHVRASFWGNGKEALILRMLIRKCLDQMENDKLRSIAIPAIDTGNLYYPCEEVAKVLFEEVTRYLTGHPLSLIDDIRFVVFGEDPIPLLAFLDAVQEIKSKSKHVQELSFSQNMTSFNSGLGRVKNLAKLLPRDKGISIKIYCDDSGRIDRAWEELKKKLNANISDMTTRDDFIKKITDLDLQKIRKLGRHFDVEIHINQTYGNVKIKGLFPDILKTQEEILKLRKDIKDRESKEDSDTWIWEENSVSHREKFVKLREYGQTHPQEIKEINDVRVCFSNEFLVGRGSDATRVYAGLSRDGYERAVKRLPRDDCACLAEQEKKILNEPNAIQSNYVVRYRYLDDKSDKDWVFLIMDLCEETLIQYVERCGTEGWTEIARDIVQHVLTGLADLHRGPKRILHRDLKPSNILRNVYGQWLLADFGISRILPQDLSTHRTNQWGTKDWRAVESCLSKDESKVRYKRESDIQVAGMVAFYIVTKGEHPFGEEADRQRNLLDDNPVYLDKLEDPAAKDLISWMLKHDPKDRPTAKEALKHPYLLSMEKQFELLCKMGNQLEIKTRDNSSDVVKELNSDPKDWKTLIKPDVLNYLCTDFVNNKSKTFHYDSSWTECLRLIRNVNQHWNDRLRPLPQPEAFYVVGDPQEYFLNIFPDLPVVVHRLVRSCEWKKRPDFKEYFTVNM